MSESDIAYDMGFTEGQAVMALRHGIPDNDLFLHSATYHNTVVTLFYFLAYGTTLSPMFRGMLTQRTGPVIRPYPMAQRFIGRT